MHVHKLIPLLLLPLLACGGSVTRVPRRAEVISKDLSSYYDHERDVTDLIDGADRDKAEQQDPGAWWTDRAVRRLEEERLEPTGDLIAACLHTPPGDSSYRAKGRPKPDQIYLNDLAFYDTLVASNNKIAGRYVEVRALINRAEKQYSHKDDVRAIALRGLVAYERLLDHHRFILRQIAAYDCLSGLAPNEVAFEEEALKSFQGMVKNVKRSGEMLAELQAMVEQEYESLSKPLADKRAYVGRLEVYSFMHRVFGENIDEVEKECRGLTKEARNYAFKSYCCGYVSEKGNHDSKASKFYAVAKGAGIEYAGPAAKRTAYLAEWTSPLQTEESRKSEGQSNYQIFIEFK